MRTKFIMSLVYLFGCIENLEEDELKSELKDRFIYMVEEAKLTDKERYLFEFETNNIGI